jgi:hypothetical protein
LSHSRISRETDTLWDVASVGTDDAICKCHTAAVIRRVEFHVHEATCEQPILMCESNSEAAEVCVCSETRHAVADGTEQITVVSDACIRADGTNGLSFSFGFVGARMLLLGFFGLACICGLTVYHCAPEMHKTTTIFLLIECLDAVFDLVSVICAQASHDLNYADDGGWVSVVLWTSVAFSVAVFVCEACAHKQIQEWIPLLLCVHVVTEDFLQTFIYIQVGATHYGAKGHVNFAICMAMGQTIAFTVVKMWEFLFESVDEETPRPPLVVVANNPLGGAAAWKSVSVV